MKIVPVLVPVTVFPEDAEDEVDAAAAEEVLEEATVCKVVATAAMMGATEVVDWTATGVEEEEGVAIGAATTGATYVLVAAIDVEGVEDGVGAT